MPWSNSVALAALLMAGTVPQQPPVPPADGRPQGTSQTTPGEARYDGVGRAGVVTGAMSNVGLTHRELAAGSFVEITALESGRTIVSSVTGGHVPRAEWIAGLSPAAAAALGAGVDVPVAIRVRRVVLTPQEEAAAREGQLVERIAAPASLIAALRKRLPMQAAVAPPPAPIRSASAPVSRPSAPRPTVPPPPRATSELAPGEGWVVQIAAVSNRQRAEGLAKSLDGFTSPVGAVYRIRLGPFATAVAAERARQDAVRRGHGDARILRND